MVNRQTYMHACPHPPLGSFHVHDTYHILFEPFILPGGPPSIPPLSGGNDPVLRVTFHDKDTTKSLNAKNSHNVANRMNAIFFVIGLRVRVTMFTSHTTPLYSVVCRAWKFQGRLMLRPLWRFPYSRMEMALITASG